MDRQVGPGGTLRLASTAAEDSAAWAERAAEGEATAAASSEASCGAEEGDEGMIEAGGG